jgi:O-antigen/teichoic acid export membrane protein
MDRMGVPVSVIGHYNFAAQFGSYFDMFVNAINMAINPMAMEQIKSNNENLAKKMIFSMTIIIMSATFLFSLWAKEIFHIMIKNETLSQIYPLAIILAMAYNYRSMYVASSNMFFYHEKTKGLLKISAIAGIGSFVFYCIVTPFFGIWGIAVVNYIFLQYMGYSGFFLKEYKENTKVSYPYWQILALTVVLTIAVFFMVEWHWMVKIIVTTFYGCIAILISKKINLNKDDED